MREFKCLWCVLGESGTDRTVCRTKEGSERKVPGVIRSLVNARNLQPEWVRVLYEALLVLGIRRVE